MTEIHKYILEPLIEMLTFLVGILLSFAKNTSKTFDKITFNFKKSSHEFIYKLYGFDLKILRKSPKTEKIIVISTLIWLSCSLVLGAVINFIAFNEIIQSKVQSIVAAFIITFSIFMMNRFFIFNSMIEIQKINFIPNARIVLSIFISLIIAFLTILSLFKKENTVSHLNNLINISNVNSPKSFDSAYVNLEKIQLLESELKTKMLEIKKTQAHVKQLETVQEQLLKGLADTGKLSYLHASFLHEQVEQNKITLKTYKQQLDILSAENHVLNLALSGLKQVPTIKTSDLERPHLVKPHADFISRISVFIENIKSEQKNTLLILFAFITFFIFIIELTPMFAINFLLKQSHYQMKMRYKYIYNSNYST